MIQGQPVYKDRMVGRYHRNAVRLELDQPIQRGQRKMTVPGDNAAGRTAAIEFIGSKPRCFVKIIIEDFILAARCKAVQLVLGYPKESFIGG